MRCVRRLFTANLRSREAHFATVGQSRDREAMVKEEKKDKLIAHHTKTGAGGDLAALDDTEDLGGARKSEYKAEPDMPEMSEESITALHQDGDRAGVPPLRLHGRK